MVDYILLTMTPAYKKNAQYDDDDVVHLEQAEASKAESKKEHKAKAS